jgi:hypothetical protein
MNSFNELIWYAAASIDEKKGERKANELPNTLVRLPSKILKSKIKGNGSKKYRPAIYRPLSA